MKREIPPQNLMSEDQAYGSRHIDDSDFVSIEQPVIEEHQSRRGDVVVKKTVGGSLGGITPGRREREESSQFFGGL
jgi:hypothetical protein